MLPGARTVVVLVRRQQNILLIVICNSHHAFAEIGTMLAKDQDICVHWCPGAFTRLLREKTPTHCLAEWSHVGEEPYHSAQHYSHQAGLPKSRCGNDRRHRYFYQCNIVQSLARDLNV